MQNFRCDYSVRVVRYKDFVARKPVPIDSRPEKLSAYRCRMNESIALFYQYPRNS